PWQELGLGHFAEQARPNEPVRFLAGASSTGNLARDGRGGLKMARRLSTMAAAALFTAAAPATLYAQATIEDIGGIRYQVTRETVPRSIPVTEMREQQQTI